MKPALSVIAFTVLSGAGLGALALLALMDIARGFGWTDAAASAGPFGRAGVLALVLVVAGLCASTLHLGNPRNAWRSLSRIRTSWLSREAAAALALLPPATLWVAAMILDRFATARLVLAVAVVPLAWLTLYCTAMIYASLKPIRAWHSARVPLAYFALGHASGALAIAAVLRVHGDEPTWLAVAASLLFAIAAVVKLDYYAYLAGPDGRLTIEQAIGVPQGVGPPSASAPPGASRMHARLLDAGHSRGTFLTREFGYTLAPRQRIALRILFWTAGLAVPVLWLAAGLDDGAGAAIACGSCLVGLTAERWLFFAEARHSVRLYHGDAST